jgi:hypothetical protein
MNIFYLNPDPKICAQEHLSKHVIKMILESCQLLSTAHRVIDGSQFIDKTANNHNITRYRLEDERERILYKATHMNHPSAIWCRMSDSNYNWLYQLTVELCKEYTYRYGKTHKCEELLETLFFTPNNIPHGPFTDPTPAMPDDVKIKGDSLKSYRNYYIKNKLEIQSLEI